MASIVSSEATERTLRQLLWKEGYSLSPHRANGETGADIIAKRQEEELFIEVIAHKASPRSDPKIFTRAFSGLFLEAETAR
jgi:Holliday junction resolvase